MSAAEEKTETTEVVESAPSGAGSKLVLILTGVNVVATLAMIGVLFLSLQKEKKITSVEDIAIKNGETSHADGKKEGDGHGGGHGEAKKEEKKHSEFGKMIPLEQFTVNLSTPGSATSKFVRVNVALEVPTPEAETEVASKMPQIRNVIIDLFNSKRPVDLSTAEGRDYLKEEIRSAINGFMVTGKVKGVFFTNFALAS